MTDQTVPVPVDLLRALEASIRGTAWETVQCDAPPLGAAVQALTDLIPTPPKVGDVIESARAVKELPVGTVLRDNSQDVWLVTEGKHLHFVNPRKTSPSLSQIDDPAFSYYKPVIVALPDNA